MIREHEVAGGACKHCGAVNPGPDSTCVQRAGDSRIATQKGRRIPAIEDFDFINVKMKELTISKT